MSHEWIDRKHSTNIIYWKLNFFYKRMKERRRKINFPSDCVLSTLFISFHIFFLLFFFSNADDKKIYCLTNDKCLNFYFFFQFSFLLLFIFLFTAHYGYWHIYSFWLCAFIQTKARVKQKTFNLRASKIYCWAHGWIINNVNCLFIDFLFLFRTQINFV